MESRNLQLVLKLQDQASAELRKVSGELGGVTKATDKSSSSFIGMAKSIAGVAAAYVSFSSVYRSFSVGVTMAADMETAEVGLTTLLGSAEEAADTVKRLKIEAARTPFELPGLTQATQLLTSVTKDGDKSIDILLDVGEGLAAMGKGQPELDRIIVNLQQIAAVGKAATIDIKQFAFAGLPIYEMLSETTGKTGEALGELIETGGVTFELLTTMFDEANDAGGRFANAFVNQSGTFNQAASNMKDSFGIMMSDLVVNIGLFDGLTNGMLGLSNAMGNYSGIIDEAKASVNSVFDLIEEKTGLISAFKTIWDTLSFTFSNFVKPALDELYLAFLPLMPYIESLGTVIGAVLVVALYALVGVLNILAAGLGIVIASFAKLISFIVNTVTGTFQFLQGAIELLAAVMVGDWAGAMEVVQSGIEKLIGWVEKLIDKFKRAISLAKDIGGGAIDFIGGILPGRATGGPVMGGTSYMVGENGPERFVPSGSGTIIPNNKLGASSGGINITINGDVTGEDAAEKLGNIIMAKINQRIRTT